MSIEIKGRKPKSGEITHVCIGGEWIVKSEVIKRIKNGEKFNVGGTNVNVIPKPPKEGEYIRTDTNETLEDNLGELSDICNK